MANLGYTWYPKDWSSSDAVFELLLDERGMFRELIDMAMMNDNKTQINTSLWCRKFAITEDKLEEILITLTDKNLVEIKDDSLFIPSCEKRLKLIRGGRNGGKKSKPKAKPISKPSPKPSPKQKEIETKKEKEIETIPSVYEFTEYVLSKKSNLSRESIRLKYESWVENGWKDGNDKPIKKWKSKALNIIPYLKEVENNNLTPDGRIRSKEIKYE